MDIALRGSNNLTQAIAKKAKEVSKKNGLSELTVFDTNQQQSVQEAKPVMNPIPNYQFNGMDEIKSMFSSGTAVPQQSVTPVNVQPVTENVNPRFDFGKSMHQMLLESVETLSVTKEYFNATQSLFTMYAMGSLNESVLDKLSREDISEIKGIVREFKSILDSY